MSARGSDPSRGMAPAGAARVVLITAPDEDVAGRIARALVDARLAACVNLVPGLTSVYRWRGEVQEDREVLLVVKTRADLLEEVAERLRRDHPYEVPELLALDPAAVEPRYLAWWDEQMAARPEQGDSGVGREAEGA